ncbi:MAG: dihydrofolate reductase family protein [Chitinophagales bacterium]
MRKIKLYIATSINGYIAKSDGSVGWLDTIPNPNPTDYGYFDFLKSVDTTLMGNATYQQILGFDVPFPYADKINYVFSRTQSGVDEYATFVSENIVEFVQELTTQEGKDIWLVGGGELNGFFLKNGLIDEMIVSVMPMVLGSGIPLFGTGVKDVEIPFGLKEVVSFETGAVQLVYEKH